MMLVPALKRHALGLRDAERRSEQVALDVVGRQAIAPEEALNVAGLNQPHHQVAHAGMDQDRSADEQGPATTGPNGAQPLADLADQDRLRLLAGDRAAHEGEYLRLTARALQWDHPHTLMAHDH